MKKLCAALITAASLLNIAGGAVLAADGGNNQWICTRVGTTNTDRNKFYSERSEKHYFSGTSSLRAVYPGDPVEGNYLEVKETLDQALTKDTSYTLSFYAKGATNKTIAANTAVNIGGDINMLLDDANWTVTTGQVGADNAKNWAKFEYTFSADDSSDYISFTFNGKTTQVVIDDVELKSDTSENYINDGSFENYAGEKIDYDEEAPDVIYTADEMPSGVIGTSVNDGVVLSWKAPNTYTGISVYDWFDGNRTLLSDEFTVNPGQVERYRFKVYDNDFHQYQIVFHYADKPDQSFNVSEKATGAWGYDFDGWKFYYYRGGDVNQTCPAKISFDAQTKHGDSGVAVRIQSNQNRAYEDMSHDAFSWISKSVALTPGQTYKVSFWVKTEDLNGDIKTNINYSNYNDGSQMVSGMRGTNDWTYAEKYYTCSAEANTFMIYVEDYVKNLWIDDIEIRIVDAFNQPYGDNLISDGDFDKYGKEPVGEITKLTAEGRDRSIKFTWRLPGENYYGCKVYQKRDNDFVYVGYTTPNSGELTVDGLDYAKTYTYRFVPMLQTGIEGTAAEVSARTDAPEMLIGSPELLMDGKTVANANAAGSYTVRTTVKNNHFDEGLSFDQLVCVYNGDELVSLHSTAKKVKRSPYSTEADVLSTSFKIDNGGSYTVKVFLIDNRTDMNLYQHSAEFK